MTDQSSNANPAIPADARRRRGGVALYVLLIALAVGLTGLIATTVISRGQGFGPPFGPGGWHHHGLMMQQFTPGQIEDRADRMIRHLAVEIDATAEQQEMLRAVVKSAVKDIIPMGEKARAARLRGRELFTQPTLDRAAIEAFRTEQMALADAFSRRITQALTDMAAILTPEQRTKIGELLPPRPGYWRGWHRG